MKNKYLEELQDDNFVFINSEDDLLFYRDYIGLNDNVTGIVLNSECLENGTIESEDIIYYTEDSRAYDLRTLYNCDTLKNIRGL